MPGLLTEIKSAFGADDLYEVLDIQTTASKAEVKKAYYKLSLTVHPDRVEKNKTEATKKFQALGKVYCILSDDDKRAYYDETGMVDDEEIADTDRDWTDYWRLLFPKIDLNDIDEFEQKYKGSDEELEDIKLAYTKYEGDMGKILDSIMCATVKDEPRFRSIINDLIESGELPAFEAFINEPKEKQATRKRKAEKEEKEAKKAMQEMNGGDSLQAMILRNQKSRQEAANDFIKQMESKYCGTKPSTSVSKKSKKSK